MSDIITWHSRVYLDSNIFIYLIERSSQWHKLALKVFEDADRGGTRLVTSDLAAAECFLQPFRKGDALLVRDYERLFESDETLELIGLDYDLLKQASRIGGTHGMKLLDAIHVASALAASCEIFITNDAGIRVPPPLKVVMLADV